MKVTSLVAAVFSMMTFASSAQATIIHYEYIGGTVYCPVNGYRHDGSICQNTGAVSEATDTMAGHLMIDTAGLGGMSLRNASIYIATGRFANDGYNSLQTLYRLTDAPIQNWDSNFSIPDPTGMFIDGFVDGGVENVPFIAAVTGHIGRFFNEGAIGNNSVALEFDALGNFIAWDGIDFDGSTSSWRWGSDGDAFSSYSECALGSPLHEDICSPGGGRWVTHTPIPAQYLEAPSPVPLPAGLPFAVSALLALGWITRQRRVTYSH